VTANGIVVMSHHQ